MTLEVDSKYGSDFAKTRANGTKEQGRCGEQPVAELDIESRCAWREDVWETKQGW